MIPDYLKGKTAPQILDEFMQRHKDTDEVEYACVLQGHLLMAILYALCATDGIANEPHAEGRAIAFLNQVLPLEPPKTGTSDRQATVREA